MSDEIYLYIGSIIIFLWGTAHIFPTRSIVKGYGDLSRDKKLILIMSWVIEGIALSFVGISVFLLAIFGHNATPTGIFVVRLFAIFLFTLALWSLMTGARTTIIPNKICPVVKSVVAILFILGS